MMVMMVVMMVMMVMMVVTMIAVFLADQRSLLPPRLTATGVASAA